MFLPSFPPNLQANTTHYPFSIRSVEKKELVLDLYDAGSADGTGVYTWPQHENPVD